MANKWIDGGELWASPTAAARAYLVASNVTFPASPRIAPGLRAINLNNGILTTPSLGVDNTWIFRFGAFSSGSSEAEWRVLNGANEQVRLESVTTGSSFVMRVVRGATVLGTTTATFANSVWHHFELSITVRTGVNGSFELRHNEQTVLSIAGVNTADQAVDGADGHTLTTLGGTWQFDDIVINDSTGTSNNTFQGDSVCFVLQPDGDGVQTDWTNFPVSPTTNFDKVDDDPTIAGADSDYVETAVNTDRDLYTFQNTPGTGIGVIQAVKLSLSGRMTTVGSGTIRTKFRDNGGTVADGGDLVYSGTSYVERFHIFDENPVALAAWTSSDIDNGQFGMERLS